MSDDLLSRVDERVTQLLASSTRVEDRLEKVHTRLDTVEKDLLVLKSAQLPAKVEALERKSWWVAGGAAALAALGALAQWVAKIWHLDRGN